MNIHEAAKSGKRFRREGQIDWVPLPRYGGEEYYFNMDELMADDWEVEEETITVSRSKLRKSCINAAGNVRLDVGPISFDGFIEELEKELGLG
jgi:hypothetical protein